MSSFAKGGQLDPSRSYIVTCVGRKGSGKSIMALLLFRSYPYDRLVLDIAGDDGPTGPDVIDLHGDVDSLPARWPEHLRQDGRQLTLRYVPDPGSPTYLEDMDHLIGVAYRHGHVGILVHEIHQLAPSGRTPPHMRRVLQMSRHQHISLFACGPRPVTVDPLVLQQSDLVYVFKLPNPNDRKRVAETIGYEPRDMDEYVRAVGVNECLRFDANEQDPSDANGQDYRLVHLPPLPADDVTELKRWALRGLSEPTPPRRTGL